MDDKRRARTRVPRSPGGREVARKPTAAWTARGVGSSRAHTSNSPSNKTFADSNVVTQLELVLVFQSHQIWNQLTVHLGLDSASFQVDENSGDHEALVLPLLRIDVESLEVVGVLQRFLQVYLHPRLVRAATQRHQQRYSTPQRDQQHDQAKDFIVHGHVGFHQPTNTMALYLTASSETQLYRFTQELQLRLQSFGIQSASVLNPSHMYLMLGTVNPSMADQFRQQPCHLEQFRAKMKRLAIQSLCCHQAMVRWSARSLARVMRAAVPGPPPGPPTAPVSTRTKTTPMMATFCFAIETKQQQQQQQQRQRQQLLAPPPVDARTPRTSMQNSMMKGCFRKNLQFLVDGQLVEQFLYDRLMVGRKSRLLLILRGLPGSGKSSLARAIHGFCDNNTRLKCTICSADSYFETSRGYQFDVSRIADAHGACRAKFRRALAPIHGAQVIVLDNTNTQHWEYKEYAQEALDCGYDVEILEMTHKDAAQALELSQRNAHGVPRQAICNMLARFESDHHGHLCSPVQSRLVGGLGNSISHWSSSSVLASRNPIEHLGRVKFSAVFLTDSSRTELLRRVTPMHSQVFADHVTLCYRPELDDLRFLQLGQHVIMQAHRMVSDAFGQCIAVEFVLRDGISSVASTNQTAHVTISVADELQARYSNELLAKDATEVDCMQIDPPLILEGVIGVHFLLNETSFVVQRSLCDRVCCAIDEAEAGSQELQIDFFYFTQSDLDDLSIRWNGAIAWQMTQMASTSCLTLRYVVVKSPMEPAELERQLAQVLMAYPVTFDKVLVTGGANSHPLDAQLAATISDLKGRNRSILSRLCVLSAPPETIRQLVDTTTMSQVITMNSVEQPLIDGLLPKHGTLASTMRLLGFEAPDNCRGLVDEALVVVHEACAQVLPSSFRNSGYVARADSIASTALEMQQACGLDLVELVVVCSLAVTLNQAEEIATRLRTGFGVVHVLCDDTPSLFFSLCSASSASIMFRLVFVQAKEQSTSKESECSAPLNDFDTTMWALCADLRKRGVVEKDHRRTTHEVSLLATLLRISLGWSSSWWYAGLGSMLHRALMLWSEVLALEFLETHQTSVVVEAEEATKDDPDARGGSARAGADVLFTKWTDLVAELGDWSSLKWHDHLKSFLNKLTIGPHHDQLECNLSCWIHACQRTRDVLNGFRTAEPPATRRAFWELLTTVQTLGQETNAKTDTGQPEHQLFYLTFTFDPAHEVGPNWSRLRWLWPHAVGVTLERLIASLQEQTHASVVCRHERWLRHNRLQLETNNKSVLVNVLETLKAKVVGWLARSATSKHLPGVHVWDAKTNQLMVELATRTQHE